MILLHPTGKKRGSKSHTLVRELENGDWLTKCGRLFWLPVEFSSGERPDCKRCQEQNTYYGSTSKPLE